MSSSDIPFLDELGYISHNHAYSRKQKSLGLLCTKFLGLYNKDGVESVCLDEAANRLGVERRRIYDIVNVIESVGVLIRRAKSRYSWIGFSGIPRALATLKEEALTQISRDPGSRNPFTYSRTLEDEESDRLVDQDADSTEDGQTLSTKTTSSSGVLSKVKSDNRREKSLGQLTQNFVKLFLIGEEDTISLDDAAKLLLSDGYDSSQMRTKVRRLYDIANVFASLDLIEKTQDTETGKPAFRWLGVEERSNAVTSVNSPVVKQWSKRTFGADITNANVDFKRNKTMPVVDQKPSKVTTRNDDISQCNMRAVRQIEASKHFTFGPFLPSLEPRLQTSKAEKTGDKMNDWDALASSFLLQYHNQALCDLFSHYMDAWKSWYVEVAQAGNSAA